MILHNLHWLPIKWRIDFKVATLTYKVFHSGEPLYLSSRIAFAISRRSLRSLLDTQRLKVLPHKLKIISRAFKHVALSILNCLPLDVRMTLSAQTFKSRLTLRTSKAGIPTLRKLPYGVRSQYTGGKEVNARCQKPVYRRHSMSTPGARSRYTDFVF